MKTVFSSHNEVAHIWASQSQAEGRAGNLFFKGDTVYSYGGHFPVARFAPEFGDIVLFTDRGYSSSTGRHKGFIRAAIPSTYTVIFCDDPSRPPSHNLDIWANRAERLRADFAAKKNKQGRAKLANEIFANGRAAIAYCDALKIDAPGFTCSTTDEDDSREYGAIAAREREAKATIRRADYEKAAALDASERLTLWLTGESVNTNGFEFSDTLLRIKGEQIETTRGAKIPVSDALKIYPLLDRAKRTGGKIEAGLHNINLGAYRFNSFDGENLIVGCHSIAWAQIEKMAQELHLIEG